MLKITKSSDSIEVKNICVCIYGEPGVGKTSLGSTAKDPLLLDFDRGAHRSAFRKDIVQIDAWEAVAGLTRDDLSGYGSLVIDTAGRLLDALSAHLINENPKLAQGNGALSLRGYGELKSVYASWLSRVLQYGVDVILLCHHKEDKRGDDMIVRPDIQGGSYGEVFKRSDGIAWMSMVRDRRMLSWSPTEMSAGKDAANLGKVVVPDFNQEPSYMAGVMQTIKDSLNRLSAEGKEVADKVAEWRDVVANMETAEQVNTELKGEAFAELKNPALAQVKRLLANRAKKLGFTYVGKHGEGKYEATS